MTDFYDARPLADPEFLALYRARLCEGVTAGLVSEVEVDEVIAALKANANNPDVNRVFVEKLLKAGLEADYRRSFDTGN